MLKKESFSVTCNEVRDWDRDGLGPKIIYNLHVTLDWLQKLDGLVKLRKAWIKVKHIQGRVHAGTLYLYSSKLSTLSTFVKIYLRTLG